MHYSVLLRESVDLLNIKGDGIYIDGTFGRGGHTREILARLGANGRLLAFDKDPDALTYARETFNDPRLTLIHDSFAGLARHLEQLAIAKVDGVLLDLGVSSPQLDTAARGFSFRFDAPLDMRMDNTRGISAAEWLNSAAEANIAEVFWRYGEEKFSRRIARAVVLQRQQQPFSTTTELADLVTKQISYREKGQHPATRVFQALRIQVNNELGDLEQILNLAPAYLAMAGRIVVISFHSLEDRIVKNQFAALAAGESFPKWVMVSEVASEFKVIAKKIKATAAEIALNSRSRSAVLRCLERVSVKNP